MQIIDYSNYAIDKNGDVVNIKTNRVLKPSKNKDGYFTVDLYNGRKGKTFYIHRLVALHFIENPLNLKVVDHINRDITNNTIQNLRWVTNSQNNQNSIKRKNSDSIYKGVYKSGGKWKVEIRLDGKMKYFGLYLSEEEAALVYNEHCTEFHIKNVIHN